MRYLCPAIPLFCTQMETLKEKTAKGIFWGGLSNGLQQVLNLAFGIVLARQLTPGDYGLVGMLSIFSLLAGALQDGGFVSALNKRRHVTQEDYTSVFWFNTLVSALLYALLFMAAPLIARYYGEPVLTPLARFVFLGFVITSFNIVPRAYMFRELKVKQNTLITMLALLVSGTAGVGMAYGGMAYWGLAAQTVIYTTVVTIGSYAVTGWHPSLRFTFRPVREMFGFSSKLIVTGVFNIINTNLFSVLLGNLYGRFETGYYTQANKWATMGHGTITNMLWGVSQPVFTKIDEDPDRQRAVFRKLLRFTAFVSFPALLGLGLVAPEFIHITIGPKWAASAVILQLLSVWAAFVPVQNLFSNLIIARGHSDIYMWATIGLALASLAAVLLSVPIGLHGMVMVYVAVNVLWLLVWHHFVHREIRLRLWQVVRDLAPYLLLTAVLVVAAAMATRPLQGAWARLAAKVLLVAVPYALVLRFSGSVIFRESLDYLSARFRHKR